MKALRDALDRVHPWFAKGALLEKAYPVYEALDTFLYTPGETTHGTTHVRDAIDLKRMMITVVMALVPVTLFGMWNTGYQANNAIQLMQAAGEAYTLDWHSTIFTAIGFEHNAADHVGNFVYGAIYFLPIYIVCMFVGGHIELVFSVLRGHEINEGFLVTGLLFPLTLPASIPLWQVALGISFGVIVAKEVFGGTGRNFLNVALTSRAFLYFAYAAQISGDKVWTAVDGFSGATALGQMATAKGIAVDSLASITTVYGTTSITWWDAFLGNIQGCIGETSTLLCIVGAAILIATGIGSWKIMAGVVGGVIATSLMLNMIGSDTNAMFSIPPQWHLVCRRVGVRIGLHGDGPGECVDDGHWQVDLRSPDRLHDGLDPRHQSGVPRRHHVGDFVRQRVRSVDRLLCDSSER